MQQQALLATNLEDQIDSGISEKVDDALIAAFSPGFEPRRE